MSDKAGSSNSNCDSGTDAEDSVRIWKSKIQEAETLLHEADASFHDVDGIGKFKNKVRAELKFLNNLKRVPASDLKRYLDTSNVMHLRGLFDVAKRQPSCCAFYKSFAEPEKKSAKREVDLVVDGGATWMKVISRNVRGLAMDFVGASGNTNRTVTEQAYDYMEMAQTHHHFFKAPKIIFEFVNGVPDRLARKLESFGIEVKGNKVNINELVKLPPDFTSDEDIGNDGGGGEGEFLPEGSGPSSSESEVCLEGVEYCPVDTVNLDVTAVFVLISSLTHDSGANYHYASRLLNAQAALERKKPALAPLLKAIQDKKLIICRTAYDSVQFILSTVAGPQEKARAEKLFEQVEVVEDKITERAAALKLSDKISERSKIIFGSGDYYKAVTATANRHFVYAASHQGIQFAVILHESRALSEQKQRTLRSS